MQENQGVQETQKISDLLLKFHREEATTEEIAELNTVMEGKPYLKKLMDEEYLTGGVKKMLTQEDSKEEVWQRICQGAGIK